MGFFARETKFKINMCESLQTRQIWKLVKTFKTLDLYVEFFTIKIGCKDKNVGFSHRAKSVQIRSFSCFVFFRIQSGYGRIQTRKNPVFRHFSRSVQIANITTFYLQVGMDCVWQTCNFILQILQMFVCMFYILFWVG